MVSEPIPDPGVGVCLALSVWPRNPMGHNEDVVSAWGGPHWAQSGQYLHGWVWVVTIFLHYLVTKYRWTNVKGGDIIRRPGLVFPDGLHIQMSERHK
ncbi:hypothetical protein CK203_076502 [Vitis vinifera]|uniref:Uncharacterized protein n=1 Tax=Vitis vinifera TaxID=29760 RepID=A0A438DB22_VITVI|nr:hypothetical protein CK203_076502 [Vitis vinifera]